MKKSGCRTMLHVYLIFFLSLLGTLLTAAILTFWLITVQKPDGTYARSDWPGKISENFKEQIIFIDDSPRVKQTGLELLKKNRIGIQILDASGLELFHYQKPVQAETSYSVAALLTLHRTGTTEKSDTSAFLGTLSHEGKEYSYILYFPVKLSKITMYLNGDHFTGGKSVILPITAVLFLIISISGILYGFRTAKAVKQLTISIREIASRRYLPVRGKGIFPDLYESLDTLYEEIRESDRLQAETDKTREEWIANITHDLKTPLSPVKGYAEILLESQHINEEQCRKYAGIMLKNAAYMETLIDDLKLTYQLTNGMVPMKPKEQNVVRFLKELVIDILNTPEFAHRTIHFEASFETIPYTFDQTLFTRAFRNLILNAFAHGEPDTEVTLSACVSDPVLRILISDNGKGISAQEAEQIFNRYYRGTSTEQKPEGTGLGLAIAKDIVELHSGKISVCGSPGAGTTFYIDLPLC